MSLTAVSQPSFWQCIPFFFGSTPTKNYPTQKIPGDWCLVSLKKLDSEGKQIDRVFHYLMENSTGDLYWVKGQKFPVRLTLSLKCGAILCGLPLYTVGMIAWRIINFLADISERAWKAPNRFTVDFQKKGLFVAILNGISRPACAVFCSLAENISKIVASPFYALAIASAALYGLMIPFEGMKLISSIEKAWHGNADYRSDIRRNHDFLATTLCEDFNSGRSGEVLYLAYCMQKRGNLSDQIGDKNRFALINET